MRGARRSSTATCSCLSLCFSFRRRSHKMKQGEEVSRTLPELSSNFHDGNKMKQREEMSTKLPENSLEDDQGEEMNTTSLENSPEDDNMNQGEQVSKTLPEELVERIIAMVPFPFVFKARVLSKSWLARFSPISSLVDDGEKKRSAISFQNQVGEFSTNWKTFCPVTFKSRAKEDLFGYDRASRTWRRLPSLSFLPDNMYRPSMQDDWILQIEGGLLLVKAFEMKQLGSYVCEPYVANVLTRSWKQLPPRPSRERWQRSNCKLVCHTRESYKVIIVSGGCHLVQIYNSESAAWNKLDLSNHQFYPKRGPGAYLNGILYIVGQSFDDREESLQILTINIEEETLEELNIPLEDPYFRGRNGLGEYLIIANGNLLLSMHRDSHDFTADLVKVEKVDLQSQRLFQVSLFKVSLVGDMRLKPVSDGDCIFFGVREDGRRMLGYNMHENEWTSFPFLPIDSRRAGMDCYQIDSSFRPGFNPFVAV